MSLRSAVRRFSVHGDFLTRILERAALRCPYWLLPIFIGGWCAVFVVVCGEQRRAIMANLRAMFPGRSASWRWIGAYQVFWNFAWSMTDGVQARAGGDLIDWEVDGLSRFGELAATDGGVIVMTAHMGNYDLAGPVFADRFGRRVNIVRAPERSEALQAHVEKERAGRESEHFAIRYNRQGAMLGVELASLLRDGEVVALQADRVLFDVAPTLGAMFGREMLLPKGPFALAMACRAPVWPMFIIRDGWRCYRIRIGERFEVGAERESRDEAMASAVAMWCGELQSVLRSSWQQWFVFERVFPERGGRSQ